MKKISARVKIVLLFLFVVLIAATAISCGQKTVTEEYSSVNMAVTDVTPVYGDVTNVVVFICFSDEDASSVAASIGEEIVDVFEGEDDSLFDYYNDLSFGLISVHSIFPDGQGAYFVYKASYSRSHYAAVKKSSSASTRYREESNLLNAALRAADGHFSYEGVDLDANDDGYVDSVTFLVSGGYDSTDGNAWGGLLWPHSWELKKITSSGSPASLNGVRVDRYSFNFLDTINTGVVSHETGHVLGMPDLYHYDHDTGYLQVAEWDLMHSFCDVPQYTLTYMRGKYLGVLPDSAVVDLKKGGTYSLKPVTTATETDVLAYRIVISDTESIWIEYRNNNVTTYDSQLPGSGLIVYRVNNSVSGNESGRNHSTALPDEVYVYRPVINGTGTRTKETANLKKAYLSPDNEIFSTLGGRNYSGKYNNNAIYLTNGVNTGISITADAISDERIIFSVDLNGYGSSEISDMYVEGDPTINYGENLNVRVKLKVKGSGTYVTADPKNYRVEYDPTLVGTQIATVVYHDEDNEEVRCTFKLVIKDPIAADGVAIETQPDKREINVGESVDLTGLSLRVRYVSGDEYVVEYSVNVETSWSVEGVDNKKSGEYYAKITYLPFDVHVYVRIKVLSELSDITVAEENTTTVAEVNGSLSVNVLGVNADGTKRRLTAAEYDLGSVDRTLVYTAQQLTVTAKEKELSTEKTVYFVRPTDLTSVTVSTLPKTIYRYGEALDLTEGRITLTFGDFSVTVSAENYFYLFDGEYRATERGKQTLYAEVFSTALSIDVTVLPPDGTFLASKNEDAIVKNNYVLFKNGISLERAVRSFSSYLSLRFTYTDGDLTYEIDPATHELSLDRNVHIEVINEEGRVIEKYRVYVFGDANDDGKTDQNDLDGWANALFTNVSGVDVYLDADGDGKYTLTDFAILVERYGGRV